MDSRALLGLDDEPLGLPQKNRPTPSWQQRNRGSPNVRFTAPRDDQHFEAASRPPPPRSTDSRALLGLDDTSNSVYPRRDLPRRNERLEPRALGNVQDENTLNGHLERLSLAPARHVLGLDNQQESGKQESVQSRVRRIQYGTPAATSGEQNLDPNVTSRWNIRRRTPQIQHVANRAAASGPPLILKLASRPDRGRRDPFGNIDERKTVTQGYKPLTARLANAVCSYCGEKGHTEQICGQRVTNNGGNLSMNRRPSNIRQDSLTTAEQNLRALKAARASLAALAPGQKLPPRIEQPDDFETQTPSEPRRGVNQNTQSTSEQSQSTPSPQPAANYPTLQVEQTATARTQPLVSAPTEAASFPKMVRWTPPPNQVSNEYEAVERQSYERLDCAVGDQQIPHRDLSKRSVFSAGRRGRDDDEDARPKRGRPRRGMDDDEDTPRVPRRAKDKMRRREQWGKDEEADEGPSRLDEARHRKKVKDRYKKRVAAQKLKPIHLPEFISVNNLAHQLGTRYEKFVEMMKELGFSDIGHDHVLTAENAGLIAMEYGFEPIVETIVEGTDIVPEPLPEHMSQFPSRPPIVTIMGHVDHGKTTLLDYLRKSSIVATEHGGITQHIGAFTVEMASGKVITFLDTPGHAAFLSMRERGANVTDIVILVVAADDGVMPQTLEAIKHARSANVPMIVALNKVDKPDANVQRVKQDLARHGIEVEEFGGDVQAIPVSGKTGQGMDMLEEAVVTLSEILDHRAPPEGNVEGWVLESATKKAGKVATVLVRRGTLRPGDIIVAGRTFARVRSLRNEAGIAVSEAGPGTPVEVDGWRGQPAAGDEVLQAPDEQKASRVIEHREAQHKRIGLATDMEAINESRRLEQQKRDREETLDKLKADGIEVPEVGVDALEEETATGSKKMYFIVKGDVSGSIEAVINAVSAIGNNKVQPHVLRSGVGQVTQFDIEHASAANGHIIAFNTTVDQRIAIQAEKSSVKIIDQSIIYRLTEDVTDLLTDALPPLIVQRVVGEAEIVQEFRITIKGKRQLPVAGCKIRNGVVARTSKVKVLRGGDVVFDGQFYFCLCITSLLT